MSLAPPKHAKNETPLLTDHLPGGAHWSFRIGRGRLLRLIDKDGGVSVGMTFFNAFQPLERYNMPDTLKGQHTFMLTAGHCLYSDMGRIFCSIVEDSFGWHDTVCGTSSTMSVEKAFGPSSYQKDRNGFFRNGRDSFLIEAGKHGLGERDLTANVNWFAKVLSDEAGLLTLDDQAVSPGSHVDLRFEMDTLVLLHTCPHPLASPGDYPRKGVEWQIFEADPPGPNDICRTSSEENGRGFENTERHVLTFGDGRS